MSKIVTMSSTVGDLTSGQTYRVRSKEAIKLVAATAATIQPQRGPNSGVLASKEGKRSA